MVGGGRKKKGRAGRSEAVDMAAGFDDVCLGACTNTPCHAQSVALPPPLTNSNPVMASSYESVVVRTLCYHRIASLVSVRSH